DVERVTELDVGDGRELIGGAASREDRGHEAAGRELGAGHAAGVGGADRYERRVGVLEVDGEAARRLALVRDRDRDGRRWSIAGRAIAGRSVAGGAVATAGSENARDEREA